MGNKQILAMSFATIVMIAAMAVMGGWIFDILSLKSILPHWVTMKFTTAFCFLLSGIILCSIVKLKQGDIDFAQVSLPLPCLLITLIMTSLLVSVILNIHIGIENLFVKEEAEAMMTTTPGQPSMGAMMAFLAMVMAAFLTMLRLNNLVSKLNIIGGVVMLVGGLAIAGYLFQVPLLFYHWEGVSSAMAFHTAVLFILLGLGVTQAYKD